MDYREIQADNIKNTKALKALQEQSEHCYYLDFFKRGAGNYIHREEIGAMNLAEATAKALESIPKLETEWGPLDKVVVIDTHTWGNVIAWKRLQDNCIARLLIPAEAKRILIFYDWIQLKAEYVKVLNIFDSQGAELTEGYSIADTAFIYTVGELAYPTTPYLHETRIEPNAGIFCYFTKEQACLHGEPLRGLDDI